MAEEGGGPAKRLRTRAGGRQMRHDATALEGGMQPHHAAKLREFCSQRIYRRHKLLIVIRASNPESLQWHDAPGRAHPKHSGIKAKTNDQGYIIHDGKLYYSDYDLQGVFIQDGRTYRPLFTGNYVKLDDRVVGSPGLNEFLRVLNQYVCGPGNPKMFIHGAQDDFVVDDVPQLMPKRTEKYLVFEPEGGVQIVNGSRNLMMYYAGRGMRWRYGHPGTHRSG
jgi:hypothetical protein